MRHEKDPSGRQKPNEAGATALELALAFVVIGIVISVFLLKFSVMEKMIKRTILEQNLNRVRTALKLYHAKEWVQGRNVYPPLDQVRDNVRNRGSVIMENGDIPDNPLSDGSDRDKVDLTLGRPKPKGTSGAWAYDPLTGDFYANTASGAGEDDL